MQAGVAKVVITPPVGCLMGGYGSRREPSQGINDDLYARALAVADGRTRVMIMACDLVGLPAENVANIRREIEAETGISAGNIAIACSHTHCGPLTHNAHYRRRDISGKPDRQWLAVLEKQICGAAYMAAGNMRPAQIGYGDGSIRGIGGNRRQVGADGKVFLGVNPQGITDDKVGIVRFNDENGNMIAAVINYACHPTVAYNALFISADYPGFATELIEKNLGGVCLFLNGACGNINPNRFARERTYREAERMGRILGGAGIQVLSGITDYSGGDEVKIDAAGEKPALDYKERRNPADALETVNRLREKIEEMEKARNPFSEITAVEEKMLFAMDDYDVALEAAERDKIITEIQVLRLGDIMLAFLPGEVFVEIGLEIKKRSPFPHTLVATYANDYDIGYIPVKAAYDEGGYETVTSKVAPDSAEKLIVAVENSINSLTERK
ncbi:MAG: neutral/alkaline non-lysosomal ceramidase N-terminal domain-containing protein [Victivallaceae bacterium]|nr:neutral/alkaline non-lysosomal ceramidase N-terminal domain-containing protein [Victivallaceae bacterium]